MSNQRLVVEDIENKKSRPLPMQYLGGKGRIVKEIMSVITNELDDCAQFVDMFSGSGVVAYEAASAGYEVIANDIQPYSCCLLETLLNSSSKKMINELVAMLIDVKNKEIFSGKRRQYYEEFKQEKKLFECVLENNTVWVQYKKYFENTKLVFGDKTSAENARVNDKWALFLGYYRNTYFGVGQCAEIDFVRELAETLGGKRKKILISCSISAMSSCVNSTTHLAQYLKPTSETNTLNVIKRKKISIIDKIIDRLNDLSETRVKGNCKIYNLSFEEVFIKLKNRKGMIIYADPPYFKEHYSRYYHVLDTFVLYDYPTLTFNPRLNKTTVGRYRSDRIISDFGKRSRVSDAFKNLIEGSYKIGAHLVLSYANTSLLSKESILKMAEKVGYTASVNKFMLQHSGQGQSRHKEVIEYLFIFKYEK